MRSIEEMQKVGLHGMINPLTKSESGNGTSGREKTDRGYERKSA